MVTLSKRAERRKKAKQKERAKQQPSAQPKQAISDIAITKSTHFTDKYYKWGVIIPLIILILAISQIGIQTATTGDFIKKGVTLAGGTSFLIEKEWTVQEVELILDSALPNHDHTVRELTNAGRKVGVVVESTVAEETKRDELINALESHFGALDQSEYTVEFINPTLGAQFFQQTFTALIVAFVLMGIVVFIYFKTFVPSIAVIASAFTDIVVTAAIANMLNIQLSTAGIAAFLMLIGYSVDTDILLSTKMLKGKGTLFSRFLDAFKTGATMTFTTIFTVGIALFFTESVIIHQIMLIVLIGLIVDLFTTWLFNAAILRWYVERKGGGDK